MSVENLPQNFITQIIKDDIGSGKYTPENIRTRFPPEPNGYLHIGHLKAFGLNFQIPQQLEAGRCHLRFDDTNPEKESDEYVQAIQEDIKWLGFNWNDHLYFASNYFDTIYQKAVLLIQKNLAFVCQLNEEEMREYRGSLTQPGKESPSRNRSVEENLKLFEAMKNGDFENGSHTLRVKIDMNSPNMNLRDPVIYRIKKIHHHRTQDKWCIYPMYDFTHALSDALEGITHSLCSLEFEDHRPLYNWFVENCDMESKPRQIEFARLNLEYTITSKRKLYKLIEEKHVDGWSDPRLPTLRGMRRRGYPPKALISFINQIGLTKKESTISLSTLEQNIRTELNDSSPRRFAVLNPIKVTLSNLEEDMLLNMSNHPKDESMGTRQVTLSKEIFIDRNDFKEEANNKYYGLKTDSHVRLRFGCIIHCDEVIKDSQGEIIELKCRYIKDSFGGKTPEGLKKPKGIIHWVSASHSIQKKVIIYDRLFNVPEPGKDKECYTEDLNPNSLIIQSNARLEKSLEKAQVADIYQFERIGYFRLDPQNTEHFHQVISLKDTWAKRK